MVTLFPAMASISPDTFRINILSALRRSSRLSTTLIALIMGFSSACRGERSEMLLSIVRQGYGLVETGEFGVLKYLRIEDGTFTRRSLGDNDSYVAGVSDSGDQLLVFSRSGKCRIDICTLDGELVRTIAPPVRGMTVLDAQMSPDGKLIAFVGNFAKVSERPSSFGLQLLSVEGEVKTLVPTEERQQPQSFGWSRDSSKIVYDSGDRILIYDLTIGTSSYLADGNNPTWSRDGVWIAYRALDGTAQLISPDGVRSMPILGRIKLGRGMRWSLDSRYILYADFSYWGIKVVDLSNGHTATIFMPWDQTTESRFRWVRRPAGPPVPHSALR